MKKNLLPTVPVFKTALSLMLILFFTIHVYSQQNIDSLEYAVDNIADFGHANKLAISPSANVADFPFNVNITGVSNGIHTLFVRSHSSTTAAPARGYWSNTNYTYFYKQNNVTAFNSTIARLEYFIDADPGQGNANSISVTGGSAQDSGVAFNADISSLSNGFHVIFLRSMDATGKWSITNYQYFYKQNNVSSIVSTIVKLEYFIDTDPGAGNAEPINISGTSSQVSGLVFNPNIGSLSNGFHVLFIRSLDANGKWSITNNTYFYKQNNIPAVVSAIIKLEYFIDTDPGAGNGKAVTFSAATNISALNFNADISSELTGFHVLFVRSLDANGKWSITNYAYFFKSGSQTSAAANIVKIEYFIDNDPGYDNASNIPVTAAADIANKSFSPDVTGLASGLHSVNVRSKDSRGNWSVNASDTFRTGNALPLNLLTFAAAAENTFVNVTWRTTFEENLKEFVVEYSYDGILFTKVGSVIPSNDPAGRFYSFKHLSPVNGINFYRLKTIQADGTYSYSDIRSVNFKSNKQIITIYPNPADKYFTVKTNLQQPTIRIFAANGKMMKSEKLINTNSAVDISALPSGLYKVRINSENNTGNTSLIILHK